MTWIWIALIGLGVLVVGQGVLMILWSVLQALLLLCSGRPEWRDYPDLDESLRVHRKRW